MHSIFQTLKAFPEFDILINSLNCLIEIERILNPRDGQIEERGNRVDITDYNLMRETFLKYNPDNVFHCDFLVIKVL